MIVFNMVFVSVCCEFGGAWGARKGMSISVEPDVESFNVIRWQDLKKLEKWCHYFQILWYCNLCSIFPSCWCCWSGFDIAYLKTSWFHELGRWDSFAIQPKVNFWVAVFYVIYSLYCKISHFRYWCSLAILDFFMSQNFHTGYLDNWDFNK